MTIAIYPGSFDPVHNGHIDVATRAARIFDHLVIAVYAYPLKNLLFNVSERTEMAREAISHLPNVTVAQYEGMTVDFAQKRNAQTIVRGLRMTYDFDREYQMALTNQALAPHVETICLFTNLLYAFLSSSTVKEIALAGGDVFGMVPAHVHKALRAKFSQER